ncbi:MAG: tetratricopeptide repeat protein [Candidatus Omnitrophota bacterium]
MRKYPDFFIIFRCVAVVFLVISVKPVYGQEDYKTLYEKLKKDYDGVVLDRNNILQQSKGFIELKAKVQTAQDEINKANAEKDAALKEVDASRQLTGPLKEQIASLESANKSLRKDAEDARKALDKMAFDYKLVPETQRENSRLNNENSRFSRDVKNLQIKLKAMEEQRLNDRAQLEISRRQIKEFKKRYEQSMAKNRSFERKIEQIPAKFAEIARENKVLIKETALMHYNLGVFYTKNKEYSRAIAEFEKDLELNPDDGAAHYNLGFIYAEYLTNRPLALTHFRKFLSLVKSEDKDVDWVRKYILTWQTWEGKKPID